MSSCSSLVLLKAGRWRHGFLFEILIQYGGELLIQLLIETAAEIGVHGLSKSLGETFQRPKNPLLATFGFALWGLIAGGLSLWLFPHSPITDPQWRRIMAVTPILAGGAMAVIGSLRRRRGSASCGWTDRLCLCLRAGHGAGAVPLGGVNRRQGLDGGATAPLPDR